MRVVGDTNVWISGVLNCVGRPAAIRKAFQGERFTIIDTEYQVGAVSLLIDVNYSCRPADLIVADQLYRVANEGSLTVRFERRGE